MMYRYSQTEKYQFSSVLWLIGSSGRHEFSGDPLPVFFSLKEAIVSSSGMESNVHSLMLSMHHFLCWPRCGWQKNMGYLKQGVPRLVNWPNIATLGFHSYVVEWGQQRRGTHQPLSAASKISATQLTARVLKKRLKKRKRTLCNWTKQDKIHGLCLVLLCFVKLKGILFNLSCFFWFGSNIITLGFHPDASEGSRLPIT